MNMDTLLMSIPAGKENWGSLTLGVGEWAGEVCLGVLMAGFGVQKLRLL